MKKVFKNLAICCVVAVCLMFVGCGKGKVEYNWKCDTKINTYQDTENKDLYAIKIELLILNGKATINASDFRYVQNGETIQARDFVGQKHYSSSTGSTPKTVVNTKKQSVNASETSGVILELIVESDLEITAVYYKNQKIS